MNPAVRVFTVAIAAAVVAVPLFSLVIALRADGNQIIEPQTMDYAVLVIATLLIALGAQLVPWRSAPYVAFLAFLGSAAFLFGILGAFGIGLAVLPLAIVATLLLYIALIVPATVECRSNGGGTSSGRWGGGVQQIFATGSVSPDGVVTGSIETPTSIATYRCEQGRIVEFHRVAR